MCVLNIYEAVNLTEDITRANGNLIAISRFVRKVRVDGQYLSVCLDHLAYLGLVVKFQCCFV